MPSFSDIARAKVNLTLHVGAPISDSENRFYGYHPLDSLVVFADLHDRLELIYDQPGLTDMPSLDMSGPFASKLKQDVQAEKDNIIMKAYKLVRESTDLPPLSFALEKNLPIAAGIGGGSANAAAVLRLLRRFITEIMGRNTDIDWDEIALSLGADVPVCLGSQTARMSGIGDVVEPLAGLGRLHALMVNPGVAVSTRDVFQKYDGASPPDVPAIQYGRGNLLERSLNGRNDLESITAAQTKAVRLALEAISAQKGCDLARMSGSGATCFGIFASGGEARKAQEKIAGQFPDWWAQPTQFGD